MGRFEKDHVQHEARAIDETITPENAIVIIAKELRMMRRTLDDLVYDPNCDTVLGRIHNVLHDTLQTFDERFGETSIAEHVRDIASRS